MNQKNIPPSGERKTNENSPFKTHRRSMRCDSKIGSHLSSISRTLSPNCGIIDLPSCRVVKRRNMVWSSEICIIPNEGGLRTQTIQKKKKKEGCIILRT